MWEQAYVLTSVAADLRISNVVDVPNFVVSALIPEAKLHVLRGAGHVFPLEREDETVGLLLAHFADSTRSAACG